MLFRSELPYPSLYQLSELSKKGYSHLPSIPFSFYVPCPELYHQHPEWFVTYGDQLYFDPALPESREYICKIVTDIVSRYDVDAIHMDDYFYPYPVNGLDFPDNASFARYGGGFTNKADWRRSNVNVLIKKLHETIRGIKPWVKFLYQHIHITTTPICLVRETATITGEARIIREI